MNPARGLGTKYEWEKFEYYYANTKSPSHKLSPTKRFFFLFIFKQFASDSAFWIEKIFWQTMGVMPLMLTTKEPTEPRRGNY